MNDFENSVLKEQLKLVYSQLPGIIILPAITAALLSTIFWHQQPNIQVILWLVIALSFTSGVGLLLLFFHKRHALNHYSLNTWKNAINLLALFSGLGWCSSVFFLYTPGNIVLQLVLLLFLYFSTALVAITMTAYQPAFVLLATPIFSALTLRLLMDFDKLHSFLAVSTLFYAITLYIFYKTSHNEFINYIQISFEKNRLAQALQLRTEQAEKANQAKSQFLAAASHDLKQPIIAQESLISALRSYIGEDKHAEIFLHLKENTEALHELFNELIEVSRIDTGNINYTIDYTDMEEMFKELESQFQPLAQDKNITLSFEGSAEPVMSDYHLLKRILVNLISNAIKYTPEGSVKIYQQLQGKKIKLVIEDSGVGISEQNQKNIFHEFFRASNASLYSEGFGLGLAIVKRLSLLLEHEIKVESEPDKGSKFIIIVDAIPELNTEEDNPA